MKNDEQKLKRTRFSQNGKALKNYEWTSDEISFDDIFEDLTEKDKYDILTITQEIETRSVNIKTDFFHIGELLSKAKKIIPHGKFTAWILLTFNQELPYPTANLYMKIYETFKDQPDAVRYIPMTHLIMFANGKFPDEIRKLIASKPELIEKAKLQQIEQEFKLLKTGIIGGSNFIKLSKEIIKNGIEISKGRTKHRLNSNARRSLHFGIGDILERIDGLSESSREMAHLFPYDPESKDHNEVIEKITKTIYSLRRLKVDLKSGDGIFKPISTPAGDRWVGNSNI